MDRFDTLIRQLTRLDTLSGDAREKRRLGVDWPEDGAETMVGVERLTNVKHLALDVLSRRVPGDFMECGTWRGGLGILMAAILKEHCSRTGESNRVLWVADSFAGCPTPDPGYLADMGDQHSKFQFLKVPLAEVSRNFERYDVHEGVEFLEGWFKDTLPGPVTCLALLRIDADMYSSTTQALEALYDRLSPGGYLILDDFQNIANCRQAILDFRARRGITTPIQPVDWCAVYWQKQDNPLKGREVAGTVSLNPTSRLSAEVEA